MYLMQSLCTCYHTYVPVAIIIYLVPQIYHEPLCNQPYLLSSNLPVTMSMYLLPVKGTLVK